MQGHANYTIFYYWYTCSHNLNVNRDIQLLMWVNSDVKFKSRNYFYIQMSTWMEGDEVIKITISIFTDIIIRNPSTDYKGLLFKF